MSDRARALHRVEKALDPLARGPEPWVARIRTQREIAEAVVDLLPELLRDCPGAFERRAEVHAAVGPSEFHG